MALQYARPDFGRTTPKPKPISPFGEETYNAALNTQAGDYDSIMANYRKQLETESNTPVEQYKYTPITPHMQKYERSPGYDSALSNYQSMSTTGGIGEAGIAALRARGISPIRSVYANAQRELDRNRSLSGGYSPNYGAASGKMAREMSEQLAGASTNVEAAIADRLSQGRLSSASGLASLAGDENRLMNSIESSNVATRNATNQLNATMPLQYGEMNSNLKTAAQNRRMQPIQGMQSQYNATPGLMSTVGNNVLQARGQEQQSTQFNQSLEEQKKQRSSQLASSILGNYRPTFGGG